VRHPATVIGLGVMIAAGIAVPAGAQERAPLPPGLEPQTRLIIQRIADSLRAAGLPADPVHAKVAEGKLKQASDAQIIAAVRALASRFREIQAGLGGSLDATVMSAAATAMAAGVPVQVIRGMRDAAGAGADANADLATALVALTDLLGQRVSTASAAAAIQSLLARRAPPDQYAKLRVDVADDIGLGRSPDQAVRARTEAIVRVLPAATPILTPTRPPAIR
jgi:hypothetical protein